MEKFRSKNHSGQAMIITTLAMGGVIFGATIIAALIISYQIRQTTVATDSAKAIFAADAGVECGLYQFFKNGDCPANESLGNESNYEMTLDSSAKTIFSRGISRTARRAFLLYVGGL